LTTYSPVDLSDSIRLRREFAFLFIGAIIVLTVHEIRVSYSRISAHREVREAQLTLTLSEVYEQNRVTLILANLVEMLNFCDVEDEPMKSSTSPPVSSSFKVVQ